jgi:hypothetical protein
MKWYSYSKGVLNLADCLQWAQGAEAPCARDLDSNDELPLHRFCWRSFHEHGCQSFEFGNIPNGLFVE